jgi:NADH-quinone oxidoreductase subunit M
VLGLFAVTGVVLGACYMLWMVKRVFFGEESSMVKTHKDLDLNLREKLLLAPLLVMIFWMGLFPNQFLNYSKASLEQMIDHRYDYELTVREKQAKSHSEVVGKTDAQTIGQKTAQKVVR